MHRLAATPGGWNFQDEGVIFVDQTPAPLVFLTAADTDIQTLAGAITKLNGQDWPTNGRGAGETTHSALPTPDAQCLAVRVANILQLQQQLSIDTYAEQVLAQAKVIVIRLLGGRAYWSYGLEVVRETVQKTGAALIVMPGDDRPDPDLISHSTVSLAIVNQLWRYFTEGGIENFVNALKFIADSCLGQTYNPLPPLVVPRVGLYFWEQGSGGAEKILLANSENLTPQPPSLQGKGEPESPSPCRGGVGEGSATAVNEPTGSQKTPHSLLKVGVLFYRAHYLAGNTAFVDALCQALAARNLEPVPVFVSSLREADVQAELLAYFQPKDAEPIKLLLNTTSFSILNFEFSMLDGIQNPQSKIENLDVPVLQVILSGGTVEQWESGFKGLSPRDMAMNVALPEVDGRIISRAISFKAVQSRHPQLETDVVIYQPKLDRIEFVADLAANWVRLRETPVSERRIALILANYPNRDGRLANGVGLDTPASCVEILKGLQQAGYKVENIPANSDELMALLTAGITNDPEGWELRAARQFLSGVEFREYFASLPISIQRAICDRWDQNYQEKQEFRQNHNFAPPTPQIWGEQDLLPPNLGGWGGNCVSSEKEQFPIAGIQLGNVFVGIQPSRGYDLDPSLNYHAPDLEPTPTYLAFYYWVRQHFQANAIVHVGKHGNLEWLPGKSVALSGNCYPEIALGAIPHFYPFIVNDPGEGSQAKRRAQAVIIDHLTPPMTRAELYGSLQELEGLIDEYYEAESLDPSRLPVIRDRIAKLVLQENLHKDLPPYPPTLGGLQPPYPPTLGGLQPPYPPTLGGLTPPGLGAGGRSGGLTPPGLGAGGRSGGLTPPGLGAEGRSGDLTPPGLGAGGRREGFTPPGLGAGGRREGLTPPGLGAGGQTDQFTEFLTRADGYLCELKEAQIRDGLHIFGQCPEGRQLRDLIVAIARHPGNNRLGLTRAIAKDWHLDFDPLTADFSLIINPALSVIGKECRIVGDVVELLEAYAAKLVENLITNDQGQIANDYEQMTKKELDWIRDRLLPALQQTQQEITYLLHGLDGKFVPSAPSGAPTRGRPEVLPTGRNFYSVDIRAIPTETAWNIGRKAAESLIELYTQENGEYPKTLGLSIWGTSTMRTGGDDLAQAFALLGVQPVWDGPSRRVVDFEILPISVLGRPRVDVTLRISGFFRDAFPNLIDLFDQAVAAVAALDEPPEQNPLAAQVKQEIALWQASGLSEEQAKMRSHYRIFGSKPGAYGAGLQGLIEAQNWTNDRDLARAYINWSCYAYTSGNKGGGEEKISAPEAFEQRLKQMQIVLHNQDNREHDLLDSDDYYQFQGGLTVAVRALTGNNPQTYFGDNSIPENPKVRQLRSEIARVYRARVVNPKWIAGVMRHGYKGAFEMAATVDYLFAYDATANCVEDFMYEGIAEKYLFDTSVQEFIQAKNPWVLRDMAERLLEAYQRGLWKSVKQEMVDKLRSLVHQAEGIIEEI